MSLKVFKNYKMEISNKRSYLAQQIQKVDKQVLKSKAFEAMFLFVVDTLDEN